MSLKTIFLLASFHLIDWKRAGKSGNVGGYRDALSGGVGGGGGKESTKEHGHVPLTTGTGKKYKLVKYFFLMQ